jgi:hypothetical protein
LINERINEGLTESDLRKKAYIIGLRLKNSGANAKTIYATLREGRRRNERITIVLN